MPMLRLRGAGCGGSKPAADGAGGEAAGGGKKEFVPSELEPTTIQETQLKFLDKVMIPAGSVLNNMSKSIKNVMVMDDSVKALGASCKGAMYLSVDVDEKDKDECGVAPTVKIVGFDEKEEHIVIADISLSEGIVVKDQARYDKIADKDKVEEILKCMKAAVEVARANPIETMHYVEGTPLKFTAKGGLVAVGGFKGRAEGGPVKIDEHAPAPKGAKKGELGELIGQVSKAIIKERKMERLVATGIKKDADAMTLKLFAEEVKKGGYAEEAAVVGFMREKREVPETVGRINVLVIRSGNTKIDCTIDFKTIDGKAKAQTPEGVAKGDNGDYKATTGTLEFKAGEVQKQIEVEIVDDDELEDAEEFYVELSNGSTTAEASSCELIRTKIKCLILSDDGYQEDWEDPDEEEEPGDEKVEGGEEAAAEGGKAEEETTTASAAPAAAEEPAKKMSMLEKAKAAKEKAQALSKQAASMAASQLNKEELMKMKAEFALFKKVSEAQSELDKSVMQKQAACFPAIVALNRALNAMGSDFREAVGGMNFIEAVFTMKTKLSDFATEKGTTMKLETKMDFGQLKSFKSPLILGIKDYPIDRATPQLKSVYDIFFGEKGLTRAGMPQLLVDFGILVFRMNQTLAKFNKLMAEVVSGVILARVTQEVGLKAFTAERQKMKKIPGIIKANVKNFIMIAPKLAIAFVKSIKAFIKEMVMSLKATTQPVITVDGKVEGAEDDGDDGDDDILGDKFKENAAAASDPKAAPKAEEPKKVEAPKAEEEPKKEEALSA